MRRGEIRIIIGALCLTTVVAGCGAPSSSDAARETPPQDSAVLELREPEDVSAAQIDIQSVWAEAQPERELLGSGTILYDAGGRTLSAAQEEILLAYMDRYYQSLAYLQAEDPADLFAADAVDQAAARLGVWETMIAVRKAQNTDLSLTAFCYELTVTDISENGEGDLTLTVRENSVQNFAAYPGVDSESLNVVHQFTLTNTGGGWQLRSHTQMDAANMVAAGRMMMRRGEQPDIADVRSYMQERRQEIMNAHTQNINARKQQAASYDPAAPVGVTWSGAYDRDAAVAYAMEWVGKRNSASWATYDRNGGNCQNYTSQCLNAGGIPMDYSGSSQWKWFGAPPNSSQSPSGRSPAWSGVKEFYAYVVNNTGPGMVAEANANFWSGEPGDLIQLGYEDNWRHVVIITQVVRDETGNAVDYLINSNTADLRNYPVSAYMYPQQRLIRIYGWNT